MGIIAANIVVGPAVEAVDTVVDRPVAGSFKSLRDSITPQEIVVPQEVTAPQKQNTEQKSPRRTKRSDKLIQYKESAFLSDMLSSSKD